MDMSVVLPEDCLSQIISRTSPKDACSLSVVSPVFKSAADSDAVWESFLPSDYQDIITNSPSSSLLTTCLSKKELYRHLCHNPILINKGIMSFALDKESGKKCYLVGAKAGISVICGGNRTSWIWPSLPESRFPEVAKLKLVMWLEVRGRIETKILSPNTTYAAYLVYKFGESRDGFETRPLEFCFYVEGKEDEQRRTVFLDPPASMPNLCRDRGDGWMEIEIGEFFKENAKDGAVVYSLFDFDALTNKHGLIIEGIEFRPKNV